MTLDKLIKLLAKAPCKQAELTSIDVTVSMIDMDGEIRERNIGGLDIQLDADGDLWKVTIVAGEGRNA